MNHKINVCLRYKDDAVYPPWRVAILFNTYDDKNGHVCSVGAAYIYEALRLLHTIIPLHGDDKAHYTHKKYWHTL